MENSTFLFVGIDITFIHATTGKSGSCSVYFFTGNLRPTILRDGADRRNDDIQQRLKHNSKQHHDISRTEENARRTVNKPRRSRSQIKDCDNSSWSNIMGSVESFRNFGPEWKCTQQWELLSSRKTSSRNQRYPAILVKNCSQKFRGFPFRVIVEKEEQLALVTRRRFN